MHQFTVVNMTTHPLVFVFLWGGHCVLSQESNCCSLEFLGNKAIHLKDGSNYCVHPPPLKMGQIIVLSATDCKAK